MKKAIAAIMCLITILSSNLPVYAAETALACPTGCGGTVITGPCDYVEEEIEICTSCVTDCYVHYYYIYDAEKAECTNCGYSDIYNLQLRAINESHYRF